jgi:hypothetical protein
VAASWSQARARWITPSKVGASGMGLLPQWIRSLYQVILNLTNYFMQIFHRCIERKNILGPVSSPASNCDLYGEHSCRSDGLGGGGSRTFAPRLP